MSESVFIRSHTDENGLSPLLWGGSWQPRVPRSFYIINQSFSLYTTVYRWEDRLSSIPPVSVNRKNNGILGSFTCHLSVDIIIALAYSNSVNAKMYRGVITCHFVESSGRLSTSQLNPDLESSSQVSFETNSQDLPQICTTPKPISSWTFSWRSGLHTFTIQTWMQV